MQTILELISPEAIRLNVLGSYLNYNGTTKPFLPVYNPPQCLQKSTTMSSSCELARLRGGMINSGTHNDHLTLPRSSSLSTNHLISHT